MKDKVSIEFVHPLGHRMTVHTTEDRVWETLAKYGRQRWTPATLPPNGFQFPLDNHDDFPWELIGASRPKTYTNRDGEEQTVVYWQGMRYVQRRGEAGGRYNMPEAIWYSRSLRDTDPPVHGKNAEYVRLITFSGPGRFPFPSLDPTRNTAGPSLEERYRAARDRLSNHAATLSDSGKEALRASMREQGLTHPPDPLTEDFVKAYEAFVQQLGADS